MHVIIMLVIKMLNIAIVDDDLQIQNYIHSILEKFLFGFDFEYSIKDFNDSVDFYNYVQNGACLDIALLDIDMPNLNGIDLAKKLFFIGSNITVIFITSHSELMSKSFGFNVFSFIKKEDIKAQLNKCLLNFLNLNDKLKYIQFKVDDGLVKFPLSSIIAITLEQRKVYVYLTNKSKIKVYATTLQMILDEIDDLYFMKVNRSTIINVRFIESTRNLKIKIQNRPDLCFEISDLQKTTLDKKFMHYLLGDNYE